MMFNPAKKIMIFEIKIVLKILVPCKIGEVKQLFFNYFHRISRVKKWFLDLSIKGVLLISIFVFFYQRGTLSLFPHHVVAFNIVDFIDNSSLE